MPKQATRTRILETLAGSTHFEICTGQHVIPNLYEWMSDTLFSEEYVRLGNRVLPAVSSGNAPTIDKTDWGAEIAFEMYDHE